MDPCGVRKIEVKKFSDCRFNDLVIIKKSVRIVRGNHLIGNHKSPNKLGLVRLESKI